MSMTPDSAVWLHDALTAAGDVAYEWRFDTDAVLWMGALNAVFGSGDTAPPTTGNTLNARINAEDLPARLKAVADRDRRNCGYDCEYRLRRSNGAFVWVHDRGRVEFSEAGLPVRQRGILRVIDRRKAQQVQVELQVNFDELTGLPNRARLFSMPSSMPSATATPAGISRSISTGWPESMNDTAMPPPTPPSSRSPIGSSGCCVSTTWSGGSAATSSASS
jgi:hypothetical protein